MGPSWQGGGLGTAGRCCPPRRPWPQSGYRISNLIFKFVKLIRFVISAQTGPCGYSINHNFRLKLPPSSTQTFLYSPLPLHTIFLSNYEPSHTDPVYYPRGVGRGKMYGKRGYWWQNWRYVMALSSMTFKNIKHWIWKIIKQL